MKKPHTKKMPVKKITNNFAPLPDKQMENKKATPKSAEPKPHVPKSKDGTPNPYTPAPNRKKTAHKKEPTMAEYAAMNPYKR